MTDLELINTISTNEDLNDNETIDIVYEVVCGNMRKYDSEPVANEIYIDWKWEDVLKLLKGTHPEYEIIGTSLNEAADLLRDMWEDVAKNDPTYAPYNYNIDGSVRN